MATHSTILAWRIPWAEESIASHRVGPDWSDLVCMCAHVHTHTRTHTHNLRNVSFSSVFKPISLQLFIRFFYLLNFCHICNDVSTLIPNVLYELCPLPCFSNTWILKKKVFFLIHFYPFVSFPVISLLWHEDSPWADRRPLGSCYWWKRSQVPCV